MGKNIELCRECHKQLVELSKCRQIPFIDIEVENRLLQDGAIRKNGLDSQITPKGDDYVKNNYYLELAKKVENEERVKELRERDSLMNQISVEKIDEQNSINKQILLLQKITIVISSISAIVTIIGLIRGCT